jgi:hypothetical protein
MSNTDQHDRTPSHQHVHEHLDGVRHAHEHGHEDHDHAHEHVHDGEHEAADGRGPDAPDAHGHDTEGSRPARGGEAAP